ncbi:MAG: Methyltransferase type 12 [Jatrophihabitantaceae bacterium]|nr:Methyltransferase type 12 [Jatrophihabitantaceae bacterium]
MMAPWAGAQRARRPDEAGRQALALYRGESRGARAHTLVRWFSCPFAPIAAALPTHGRILEIGCGHGLFSAYAALIEPGRSLVGTDIDADKIAHAQAALAPISDRVAARVAPDGEVPDSDGPDGGWDAIVIVDMLYLLPEAAQRALLRGAAAKVRPGGRLVVKEMSTSPSWKARWNRLQETLSVRVLRITEGGTMAFVDPGVMAGWLRTDGFGVEVRRLDAGRLHPHAMLIATRPGTPS